MKHRCFFLFLLGFLSLATVAFSQPGALGLYTFDIYTVDPTYILDHLGHPLAVGSIVQVIVDSLNDGIDPPQANGMPGGDDRLSSSFPIGAGLDPMEPGLFAVTISVSFAPWRIPGCLYEGQHFYLRAFESFSYPIPAGTYYREVLRNGQLFVVPGGDTDLWNISSDTMRYKTGLQILDPNRLSRLLAGANHELRWVGGGFTGGVRIQLNRNYPTGTWETLFDSTANDSTERWTVTQPVTGRTAKLKMRAVADSLIQTISENFQIARIGLLETEGDTSFTVGDSFSIRWQTSPDLTSPVNILLNLTGQSGNWEPLFSNTLNDSHETWVVNTPRTVGAVARLRIESAFDPPEFDESIVNFAIKPKIRLLQPNGGEQLSGGDMYTIRWQTEGARVDDEVLVAINMCYPLWTWEPIGIGVDSLVWQVSTVPSVEARIKVSYLSPEIQMVEDVSDTNLTILQSSIEEIQSEMPKDWDLGKAYPNPFNATTSFKIAVPRNADVRIALYNTMGQKVTDLHNGSMKAGYHLVTFNASQLSSGSYIVRMDAPGFTNSQMIQLVK